MARENRQSLTKLQIVRVALRLFLERGYSSTTSKTIADELKISCGNLTFHFPTKEHLLAELTDLLCRFQWKRIEVENEVWNSSVMAICLELMVMAAICEEDAVAKDFYISAYTSPMCMALIRKNDTVRAKKVFSEFCPDWTHEHFAEAEILVSGIEYATLMTVGDEISLEMRIAGALDAILNIYGVPKDIRKRNIERVLAMDYRQISRDVLAEFKQFVTQANEQAMLDLLNI